MHMIDLTSMCALQLVCSLAVLGHKDAITDVFLGAVSDEAVRCISKFSPDDLCNIVWAAASVGHGSMIEAELMETVIRRMVLLEMHKASCTCKPTWHLETQVPS